MTDPANFRLRVTFCKQGRLCMLSHLEIARALERAVRRAGLPYAISQGFSPHMKIAFGAALPVGVGGTCELFDLQLTRYVAPQKALAALQAASVADLMPSAARYIEHTAPAASVAFPKSTYLARLSALPEGGVVVPETVTVVRKKKEKTLAVGEYLLGELELALAADGDAGDASVVAQLRFKLESKPTGSLRPDVLLANCTDGAGDPLRAATITRVAQEA
uniref:DUF2344 domain-containing protein n=1 Tax=Muribaculaceae bacterium Z82 TaxID=2304548 RepID=A0A7C9NVC6_9BACT